MFAIGTGCTDSTNGPDLDENGIGIGRSAITVTGSVNDEHKGAARYTNQNHEFTILLGGQDNDNFDVDIAKIDFDGGVTVPSPGTYTIGNLEREDFRADYVNRRLGGSFFGDHHYISDLAGATGVLVIESVSNNVITGSFEFTASRGADTDLTPIDPLTVTGEFRAVLDD
ncbi:MAG: hypothetical protein EA391_09885 [Balneolaceae bacterium]|nr:MAG: hypothetical protein EA391_09885 [Balneolaceae bacterium]